MSSWFDRFRVYSSGSLKSRFTLGWTKPGASARVTLYVPGQSIARRTKVP